MVINTLASIGFVIAMECEAQCIESCIENRQETEVAGFRVIKGDVFGTSAILVVSGVGKVNAAAATEVAILQGATGIVNAGFAGNVFLLSFLGFSTAVIGGTVRDICAGRIPAIFRKHVYAVAAIVGAITTSVMLSIGGHTGVYEVVCCVTGFALVVVLRVLAFRFKWNLPRIRSKI